VGDPTSTAFAPTQATFALTTLTAFPSARSARASTKPRLLRGGRLKPAEAVRVDEVEPLLRDRECVLLAVRCAELVSPRHEWIVALRRVAG